MRTRTKSLAKRSNAMAFLERLSAEPLSLGTALRAIREGEGWSQTDMGQKLGVSRAHICDIEKGRRSISPERAAYWAKVLGYPEKQMVRLALQALLDEAGLGLKVDVSAA